MERSNARKIREMSLESRRGHVLDRDAGNDLLGLALEIAIVFAHFIGLFAQAGRGCRGSQRLLVAEKRD
jgi:hypothetical protein